METRKYDMLEQLMHSNRLVINPDKTHLIVMGSKKHYNLRKNVISVASGHVITPTGSENFLGGQLHQSLTWNHHLELTD